MTIAAASEWYRGQLNKLGGMIDKKLPLEAQIIQAEKVEQEILSGETAALYDPALVQTLREAWVRPSIEKLKAEIGGAGDKLLQAVLDKLTAPVTKPRFIFETGACFVAGTLVHTKEGLVPIEKLKIGDWVLSRPENPEDGTETAYKRVVNTFVHHDKEVLKVQYRKSTEPIPREPNTLEFLESHYENVTATIDHPFWVEGFGWTAASELEKTDGMHEFVFKDGVSRSIGLTCEVCRTDQPHIGWILRYSHNKHTPGADGTLWDYAANKVIDFDSNYDFDNWAFWGAEEDAFMPYKTTVYNIEVEDYHTYFVGETGVWVHNANCDGVKLFKTGANPSKELLPEGIQIYATEADLLKLIRDGEIKDKGFALVKTPWADRGHGSGSWVRSRVMGQVLHSNNYR